MAAPKGKSVLDVTQQAWQGIKLFATPEALWEAACEYFQWCDEKPMDKQEKAIQRTMPVRRKKR